MNLTIGVDVGGTKIAGGVVNTAGEILLMSRKPTNPGAPGAVAHTILDVIDELRQSYDVSGVGIGAAGFIDASRSTIIFAPNVSWRNEPLAATVSQATNLPVVLENDANAAAWGEFRFGAAQARNSAVVVTVGTGIGGGIILNGQLLHGSFGFAGEIGHMNMIPDGVPCGCGGKGCWEVYSSGKALVRYAREQAAHEPARASQLLELAGGKAADITGLDVSRAAHHGDEIALAAFAHISRYLGQGLADLSALVDPEVFVLAGGVSEAGNILLDPVTTAFHERVIAKEYRPLPTVVLASLGNDAGIIGAADLARTPQRSVANPQ